ncbi:MAG: Lrp/AsnC family transcriptional regulator [Promethearchaeota archaeon]
MRKPLDQTDRYILTLLTQDADVSMEKLKDTLDIQYNIEISRQAVQARVKKLKDREILKIKGVVDYKKLGKNVLAFILVSFISGVGTAKHAGTATQPELAQRIAELPDVLGVWIISGAWDILVKVHGESLEEIGNLVLDKIRSFEGVGNTMTCACFSAIKEEY